MKDQKYYEGVLSNKTELLKKLDRLFSENEKFTNNEVNYELETISMIEEWYIEVLNNHENIEIYLSHLEDIVMLYYGEACIFHVGGRWHFPEKRTDINYQTPVIRGSGDLKSGSLDVSTLGMIKAIQKKRKGGQMYDSINYFLNKIQINKKLLDQMENLDDRKKVKR